MRTMKRNRIHEAIDGVLWFSLGWWLWSCYAYLMVWGEGGPVWLWMVVGILAGVPTGLAGLVSMLCGAALVYGAFTGK
jgi:Na+/melibiose symporter-like transporter